MSKLSSHASRIYKTWCIWIQPRGSHDGLVHTCMCEIHVQTMNPRCEETTRDSEFSILVGSVYGIL